MITRFKALVIAIAGLALGTLSISPAQAHHWHHWHHWCHCHHIYPSITYGLPPLIPYYYYSPYTVIAGVLTHTTTIIIPKD